MYGTAYPQAELRTKACAPLAAVTLSRFPRCQRAVQTLPPEERMKIEQVARRIRASLRPGCAAVRTVRLVGHADRDAQRGPAFERRISGERAVQVKQALIRAIRNPGLAGRIDWQTVAAGATRVLVPFPATEMDRALNRRVEITLAATRLCNVPVTAGSRFNAWLQKSLNRVLGVSLPVTGRFDGRTRAALFSFQTRNRLIPTPSIQPAALSALALSGGLPLPCDIDPVDNVCAPLSCPEGNLSGKRTISLRSGPVVFDFCWTRLGFNPENRSEVDPVGRPVRQMRFSCRKDRGVPCPEGQRLLVFPAWKYQGAVSGSGAGLGKASDWHFSFIQTVRASRWLAVYSGGGALTCVVNAARDAFTKGQSDTPPWYCTGAVVELCDGNTAVIEDSPAINFPIVLPQDHTQELRTVCFKAKFGIWLGVKKKADPPAAAILLAHKHIEVQRKWRLMDGATVISPSSWLRIGGQKESASGVGPGPTTPVLTGRPANQLALSCPTVADPNSVCSEPATFEGQAVTDAPQCPGLGKEPPLVPCAPQ
jgi:hypothetical protein